VRGRQLLDVFPVAFLPKDHALAIAIMSYNGRMNFGLLGDYDALPDIDDIAEGIEASLAELLDLARQQRREAQREPANA
jgi:diacylglycerol O-acyltransferase / wax synthase